MALPPPPRPEPPSPTGHDPPLRVPLLAHRRLLSSPTSPRLASLMLHIWRHLPPPLASSRRRSLRLAPASPHRLPCLSLARLSCCPVSPSSSSCSPLTLPAKRRAGRAGPRRLRLTGQDAAASPPPRARRLPAATPCPEEAHDTSSVMAKKFGAALVSPEHRYYGKSSPFEDLTTENLRQVGTGTDSDMTSNMSTGN
ncbi:hypothetical protein ZWY2020_011830 [Hordeum vulgare]|nr:hypothetical protein ZWY2020_011830 [Hordeum vulgare]